MLTRRVATRLALSIMIIGMILAVQTGITLAMLLSGVNGNRGLLRNLTISSGCCAVFFALIGNYLRFRITRPGKSGRLARWFEGSSG